MGFIKIGRTSFNLDALKGVSKTAFLKGGLGHTLDAWEALQEHIPQPKKLKSKDKAKNEDIKETDIEEDNKA